MTALLVFPVMAIANRVRGGMLGVGPVRWLFVVSALVGLVLGLIHGPEYAGWGLAYLVWGSPPWGRWYDLGRLPENYARKGPPQDWSYEWIIGLLPNDHLRLFARHLVLVPALAIPGLLLGKPWLMLVAVPAAGLIVLAYEAGWQLCERGITRADKPIDNAEWLTGLIWGGLIYITL